MYKFLCGILKLFMMMIFRVEVRGAENIPEDGGIIICCNHISNWDPPLLQAFTGRRIYFMAKDELFHAFLIGWIFKVLKAIPVKRNGADLAAVKSSIRVIKDGGVLGIFPTGQREKVKGEGEVKGGLGLLAAKTGCPVVPVHITANYRIFSKVVMSIGEPKVHSIPEGEKLTVETSEIISNEIYAEVKKLGGV